MNQTFLLAWAIGATAVALLAVGYALGKRAGIDAARSAGAVPQVSQDTEGDDASAAMVADPYVVPPAFVGLPSEWRTPFDGSDFAGYAILFDPQRRELIVEQCRHRGYVDRRSGALIDPGWQFCEGVLWGRLQTLTSDSATVLDRERGVIEALLAIDGQPGAPRLSLSFSDHRMTLVPGSKNALLQAMETSPEIAGQRDRYLRASAIRDDARRRVARDAGAAGGARDVPVYALPESRETTPQREEP